MDKKADCIPITVARSWISRREKKKILPISGGIEPLESMQEFTDTRKLPLFFRGASQRGTK